MATPDNPTATGPGEPPAILDHESQSSPRVSRDRKAYGGTSRRLSAIWAWLRNRADSPFGRLAFLWFRRYLEASRNSGAAATTYLTLSVLPTALVVIAIFNLAKADENAFADRLITHMNLDGSTASLVRELFGTTSNNLLAASVTIVIGFLLWGLSVGQRYQDLLARAWGIRVGGATDQGLFTIWFFVASGLVALMLASASELQADGWLVVLPVWISGSMIFWLWTPRFLLHRRITIRSLLPGALLATFVVGGSFGVVLALLAYILTVVTISMACAVFAPVWAEWRQAENERNG